uniref:Uncharacterized protein n=1 Tax=Ascaris lumbricoides TaxID=6252 RepID=A0A0M3ISG7_ASCLU
MDPRRISLQFDTEKNFWARNFLPWPRWRLVCYRLVGIEKCLVSSGYVVFMGFVLRQCIALRSSCGRIEN